MLQLRTLRNRGHGCVVAKSRESLKWDQTYNYQANNRSKMDTEQAAVHLWKEKIECEIQARNNRHSDTIFNGPTPASDWTSQRKP